MTYCSWSTDDYRCDLYAYATGGSWCIHLAPNRIAGDVPRVPGFDAMQAAGRSWAEAKSQQLDFIRKAERIDIDLPHAGGRFVEKDIGSFEKRLMELRGLGYRFPDTVLTAVRAEMSEPLAA